MTQVADYYQDKVAVVTGGASGIGLALAGTLLTYGAKRIILGDVSDENLTRETACLDATYPNQVLGLYCDVTQETQVAALIRQAAEVGDGRVDFLFNNAGAGFGGVFDQQSDADWERAFALNFFGALYGIRAVLPIMRARGSGHIVNIISGIAFMPMGFQTMYAATKAALNGLSLALRYELWDENIRVSSATPGTTRTAIWKGTEPPPYAQSASQSAETILAGVASNERLVLGDANDEQAAKICFAPDAAEGVEKYLLNVARKRRNGEWVV